MASPNTLPRFVETYRSDEVLIQTADTSLTAPAVAGTVWTAGAQGSRIDLIVIQAVALTAAGMVRIFVHDGAAYFLFREVSVTAIPAPGSTTQAFHDEIDLTANPLYLASGYTLRATTAIGDDFVITAVGGDY